MGIGRALTSTESVAYDHVSLEVKASTRIVRVPFLVGGYAGMTLGSIVLLAQDVQPDGSSTLLAHELVHVEQWHRDGVLRFLAKYLGAFLRGLLSDRNWGAAYRAIPAESEARTRTSSWQRERHARRRP